MEDLKYYLYISEPKVNMLFDVPSNHTEHTLCGRIEIV